MGEYIENHNVKSLRKAFAERGVFYTDKALAETLKDTVCECLGDGKIEDVYDPTCGSGNLLAAFPNWVMKWGQEIDPSQAEVARKRLTNCAIQDGDTLVKPAFIGRKFRAIVANYPFSLKWHPENADPDDVRFRDAPCLAPPSRADYAFILHILHYLADDGCAAVLCAPGILFRGNREGRIRRWLVQQHVIRSITQIEGGHFVDTKIATALLVLQKGRDFKTITFTDTSLGKSAEVSCDEILADEDAILTPNRFIEPDEKPQTTVEDILEIDKKANDSMIDAIDKHLELVALRHDAGFGHDPVELANKIIDHCNKFIDDYQNNKTA